MSPVKKRKRTVQRELVRNLNKLATTQEKLFQLAAGGAASHPLLVDSASLVETQAQASVCPLCNAEHEILEHKALTVGGIRLREAQLRCRNCGSKRSLWFEIRGANPN